MRANKKWIDCGSDSQIGNCSAWTLGDRESGGGAARVLGDANLGQLAELAVRLFLHKNTHFSRFLKYEVEQPVGV
jgi:hypothetical protein